MNPAIKIIRKKHRYLPRGVLVGKTDKHALNIVLKQTLFCLPSDPKIPLNYLNNFNRYMNSFLVKRPTKTGYNFALCTCSFLLVKTVEYALNIVIQAMLFCLPSNPRNLTELLEQLLPVYEFIASKRNHQNRPEFCSANMK